MNSTTSLAITLRLTLTACIRTRPRRDTLRLVELQIDLGLRRARARNRTSRRAVRLRLGLLPVLHVRMLVRLLFDLFEAGFLFPSLLACGHVQNW